MRDDEKLAVILHLGSRHGANRERYEESNPGVGFRAPMGRNGAYYGGGVYRNSLGRTSLYGGVGKEVLTLGDLLGLRLNAGVISGYNKSVLPFVIPELRIKAMRNADVLLQYIPEVHSGDMHTDRTLGLSLRIPFGRWARRPVVIGRDDAATEDQVPPRTARRLP